MPTHLWIRHESRTTERRTPVVPQDVRRLLDAGFEVTVEESPQRVFPIAEYAAAGARVAPAGAWVDQAPDDAFVIGVKELPDEPSALRHRHIYFAHAFKHQSDAAFTLGRFRDGGGTLYDVEYLVDASGRRVVAFGYWAGYVGASLGVLQLLGALERPLSPTTKDRLDAAVRAALESAGSTPSVLVTGSRGRSGRGAIDALTGAGLTPTRWERSETRVIDKAALMGHDLLVNCVVTTEPTPPFVSEEDLHSAHRLSTIADVTCDVTGPTNMLPVNRAVTTWADPAREIRDEDSPGGRLDVIAIDNLPSLLPREASTTFSADLVPHLLGLADPQNPSGPWVAARAAYDTARADVLG